jgi:hypothetical protein
MELSAGDGWIKAELFWRIEAVRDATRGNETAKVSLRSYLQQRNLWHHGMVHVAGAGPAVTAWRKARTTSRRTVPPRAGRVKRSSGIAPSWDPTTGRFVPFPEDWL